jgi:hypothetical protein
VIHDAYLVHDSAFCTLPLCLRRFCTWLKIVDLSSALPLRVRGLDELVLFTKRNLDVPICLPIVLDARKTNPKCLPRFLASHTNRSLMLKRRLWRCMTSMTWYAFPPWDGLESKMSTIINSPCTNSQLPSLSG